MIRHMALDAVTLAELKDQLHTTGSIDIPENMEFGELDDIASGIGLDLINNADGTGTARIRPIAAVTAGR
jgi:hypothetical protein